MGMARNAVTTHQTADLSIEGMPKSLRLLSTPYVIR